MPRIALGIEYDGRGFLGWQSQPAANGIQDHLEHALAQVAAAPVRLHSAGRTDTGVHATLQIAHFQSLAERPAQAWVRGVNALLPDRIGVRWAVGVDDKFHARFCALSRSYTYYLLDSPVRPALTQGRVGWFHQPLELDLMRSAALCLLGENDFTAFRAAQCQARSPVRLLHQLEMRRRGEYIQIDLKANAFLHHMVRNIVGCLVYVGARRQPPQWIAELLAARDRTRAAPTFAAEGLYLTGVEYDACWALPETSRGVALL